MLFFCLIACSKITNENFGFATYQTETISYAKANKNCLFFRSQSMSDGLVNLWFEIPETYFVSILSKISDTIYRAQYDNYVGYVYADSVSIVSFLPTAPFLKNITFDIKQNVGTQIWSCPSDTTGRVLSTISADTKQVEYIASVNGEIPIGGTSNIWYYAKWTPASSSTSVYEGYVYSESTTNLSHISNNLEYEPEIANQSLNAPIPITSTAQTIMIILIVLPFLILFVLFTIKLSRHILSKRQTKQPQEPTVSSSPQFVRKVKKSSEDNPELEVVFPEYDYIDDDDLL
ncbi:MAG: hypothetical protein IJ542_02840 [Clostridia bacterium]|nr:hypothetical protein [Clostridia bacterium]